MIGITGTIITILVIVVIVCAISVIFRNPIDRYVRNMYEDELEKRRSRGQ